TELLYRAGVPRPLLHLLPGSGETIGAALCAHAAIDGIVFTGWDTARAIQTQLAQRDGAMIPFIAETAGINALIADSTAQPQQLVQDVVRSAFDSAGQRCSALRLLYLPESTADTVEPLLFGAIEQLQLGDPLAWDTDIGPIIDARALSQLQNYLRANAERIVFQLDAPTRGNFIGPTVIRLQHIDELTREAFGPILHLIRYRDSEIDSVVDAVNALGFGLTCGIHSRNMRQAQALSARLRVGNIYLTRDMIGAVVGAQPFGGRGKSGTGPK